MSSTEDIWHEYHERLAAFVGSRIERDAVEDLLQDIFTKIHKRLNTLKDDSKLESWVYQIARNSIIDHYRTRRPTESLPDWVEGPERSNDDEVRKEFASCLEPIIQRLPEKYREAIQLSEIDRRSQQEVADQIGISLSGAKSRVQRGRVLLKGLLQECCDIEFNRHNQLISYENKDGTCADC
ncbi:MAG: RNA polymerase sigma factor SigZ [Verrucomicrobiota bacterium]